MPTYFELAATVAEVQQFGFAAQKKIAIADKRNSEAAAIEETLSSDAKKLLQSLLDSDPADRDKILLAAGKRLEAGLNLTTAKSELAKLADRSGPYKDLYGGIEAAANAADPNPAEVQRHEELKKLLAAVAEQAAVVDGKLSG